MKTTLRTLILNFALIAFAVVVPKFCIAENYESMFSYNEQNLTSELAELSELEAALAPETGESTEYSYSFQLSLKAMAVADSLKSRTPILGIPSFWWGFVPGCLGVTSCYGCCLGPVGVLVVHYEGKDREETKKAMLGCFTGSALGVAGFLIFYLLLAGLPYAYM